MPRYRVIVQKVLYLTADSRALACELLEVLHPGSSASIAKLEETVPERAPLPLQLLPPPIQRVAVLSMGKR